MITLIAILFLFLEMSLLAIGGVASTLPAMARAVVAHHWMTSREFVALFGVAQSAPGPNMLIATLVGLHVAGIPGALVGTVAMIVPSSTLTLAVAGAWERFRAARWRRIAQAAITPISGGLLLASGFVLSNAADHNWRAALITIAVAAATLRSRVHPLLLLGAGTLIGVLGYG